MAKPKRDQSSSVPFPMMDSADPTYGPVTFEEVLFDTYCMHRARREALRTRLLKLDRWCAMNGIAKSDVPALKDWTHREIAWMTDDIEHYERHTTLPKPWVPGSPGPNHNK